MAEIQKGYISTIDSDGTKARVVPDEADGTLTPPLAIHASLRNAPESLRKGVAVLFALFPDRTGIVLCRADGEA